jgi:hypothetical protein
MRRAATRTASIVLLMCAAAPGFAQQLDMHFSCSSPGNDHGDKVIYADSGEMHLTGDHIETFRWESSLFRSTHGFDCSIDDSDHLKAEVRDESGRVQWRVMPEDALEARVERGYQYLTRPNCTIRLVREGDTLEILPSCPALCGSRPNFTQLSVNLKTGKCMYEE